MIPHVVAAEPLEGYRLHLRCDDGTEGIVDVGKRIPFRGVFALLDDPERFREVAEDREAGTLV